MRSLNTFSSISTSGPQRPPLDLAPHGAHSSPEGGTEGRPPLVMLPYVAGVSEDISESAEVRHEGGLQVWTTLRTC